jgi:hypothetical protein
MASQLKTPLEDIIPAKPTRGSVPLRRAIPIYSAKAALSALSTMSLLNSRALPKFRTEQKNMDLANSVIHLFILHSLFRCLRRFCLSAIP